MEELVLVLRPAVAAVMRLQELDPASGDYQLGATALWNFLSEIADRQPGPQGARRRPAGVDAALARHPLEVVRVSEALTRLAAQTCKAQSAAPPGQALALSMALLDNTFQAMTAIYRSLAAAPAASLLSVEGLAAVSGLVESAKKYAVQLGARRTPARRCTPPRSISWARCSAVSLSCSRQ